MNTEKMLELFFSQALSGAFFVMIDDSVKRKEGDDDDQIVDYIINHHKIVKVNQTLINHYDAREEDFIGKTISIFLCDIECERKAWKELLEKGETKIEIKERTKSGREIFIERLYVCSYNEEGDVVGCIGLQKDVTVDLLTRRFLSESEKYLNTILQVITDVIVLCDKDGVYLEVIANDESKLYINQGEVVGKKIADVLPEKWAKKIIKAVKESLKSKSLQNVKYSLLLNGDERWFEARIAPLDSERVVAFIADITDSKNYHDYLRLQLRFQEMLSGISASFIFSGGKGEDSIDNALSLMGHFFDVDRCYIFDASRNILQNSYEWCKEGISPQKERIYNFAREDWTWLMKRMMNENIVFVDTENIPKRAVKEREELQIQEIKTMLMIPFLDGDKINGFIGFDMVKDKKCWSENEISMMRIGSDVITAAIARERREEEVRYLSYNDQITGLYNRTYLKKRLKEMSDEDLSTGIIITDLNGLKVINDTYGHGVGDRALEIVSSVIKDNCPENAIAARWGGDEFVIAFPNTTEEILTETCHRIRSEEEYVDNIPLSLAAGWCIRSNSEEDVFDILREAENNMHKQKLSEGRSAKSAVLNALLNTLAEKSYETREHTRRMQRIGGKLGQAIGLSGTEMDRLNLTIFMHDIGKINISEDILKKSSNLDDEEWAKIREHPLIGYRIAKASESFGHVAEEILSHHEKWDGSGYPNNLSGDSIPLLARIVSVVDAYEVMKNGRPYKQRMSDREIIKEVSRCSGSHFDPQIAKKFIEILSSD